MKTIKMVEAQAHDVPTLIIGADPDSVVTVNTKAYACADCGGTVSLAPSSQEMLRKFSPKIICLLCAVPYMIEMEDGDTVLRPSDASIMSDLGLTGDN